MLEITWRKRKALLLFNYAVLLSLLIILNLMVGSDYLSPYFLSGAVLLISLTALSFKWLYYNTGVWQLTHSRAESLDEREVVLAHKAVSFSYGLFTVLSLSLFLILALVLNRTGDFHFLLTIPTVSCLIYVAHTLPGAYILWKEKYI